MLSELRGRAESSTNESADRPAACLSGYDRCSAMKFFPLFLPSLSLSPYWVFLGSNYSQSGQSVFLFLGLDAQTPGPGQQVLPRNRWLTPKGSSVGADGEQGGWSADVDAHIL